MYAMQSILLFAACIAHGILFVTSSVAAAAGAGSVAEHCHRPAPVFMWGSAAVAAQRDSLLQKTQVHDGADIAKLALASPSAAKIVVVILLDDSEYSTTSVAAAAAQGKFTEAAAADAMLPYVYPSERRLSEQLHETADSSDALTVTQTAAAQLSKTVSAAHSSSSSSSQLITVAHSAAPDALDATIAAARAALTAACGDAFLLIVASDAPAEGCGKRRLQAEAKQTAARRAAAAALPIVIREIKITPCILAGLLFFFFFLGALYMGLGCLGDIEYPKTFILTEQQPALGREY
jgi:hypothetical protein